MNTPDPANRPCITRPLRLPPRPLLRQVLTVCPPHDPEGAVTLEIIVLGGEGDDEESVGRADLPDLQEGGWIGQMINDLSVYVRTIG